MIRFNSKTKKNGLTKSKSADLFESQKNKSEYKKVSFGCKWQETVRPLPLSIQAYFV